MNFYFLLKILFSIIYSLINFIGQFLFTNNDYSEYKFLGEWSYDTEVIGFFEDKEFAYYEPGAGNAVGDYDLCETYFYNDFNNTFNINCSSGAKDVSRNIKLISVNDRTITLKFDNEEKIFVKVREYSDYKFTNFWQRESNGRLENLRIYSDGEFSYTYEKSVPEDLYDELELYDSDIFSERINDVCLRDFVYDDFIDENNNDVNSITIDCPLSLFDKDYYVYDKNNKSLRIFSSDNSSDELVMKILFVDDDSLRVQVNDEIIEFVR